MTAASDTEHHPDPPGRAAIPHLRAGRGLSFLPGTACTWPSPRTPGPEVEARLVNLRQQLEILELVPQAPAELEGHHRWHSAGFAPWPTCRRPISLTPPRPKSRTFSRPPLLIPRLDKIITLTAHRLQVLRLSHEIGAQTQATFSERQRQAVLREQLATIQRELGEDEGGGAEIAELNAAIDKADMPEEVAAQARKEVRRLQRTPEASGEYGMIRAYLDWLIELPLAADPGHDRHRRGPEDTGRGPLRPRKDQDPHPGIPGRAQAFAPEGKAPDLLGCFVGPPGVGKTSLGRSIARAIDRPFVRVSLGGTHDEAEIRGHRRTYVGALPGNIVQAIRKAGRRDCVMMLDEIDKMGAGIQGDPSAAMLEVLDPEQNATFRDNYLGVPFDLSRVTFITTANALDTVPGPLRDRMEIIELSAYTAGEKLQIAKRYLVRRQLEANGLKPDQVTVEDSALVRIIQAYTREAGVRWLEREIGHVMRSTAMRIAEGAESRIVITDADLEPILGQPRFENEAAMRTTVPGVATGLAWTPVGGDILFIEAAKTPGSGRLILTGQLGEVMRESAQAALSLVKTKAASLGIDEASFEKSDIHVHVPAGATPKDGPSAGVAMFTALTSLLPNRTVRSDTAMTGEISLRGLVLPVGGIREKVIAAAAAGITRVMLPARNRRDYDEIPQEVRDKLEFVWLHRVDDAVDAALAPLPANAA